MPFSIYKTSLEMCYRLRPPNSQLNQSQQGENQHPPPPLSHKAKLIPSMWQTIHACLRLWGCPFIWVRTELLPNCRSKPLPLLSVLTSHLISSCYYRNLFCFKLYSFPQAFNKIHLAQYVHWLADQLHADAMQQLEMTMLRTPVANCIEVLASGLSSSCDEPVTRVLPGPLLITSAKAFTHTPPAPPPVVVPIVGVTDVKLQEVTVTSEGPMS